MADPRRRHALDRGGDWYVDTTCIDCDVARQVAPGLIAEAPDGRSYFARPPETAEEKAAAWRALLACPTGSIGAPRGERAPDDAFPFEVAPGAFLVGYNARHSFGANAYFVPREAGNLLVDAPRWVPKLADALEARGGVSDILLTHRDDVADYDRYAARFGARVWIHEADADAAPAATDLLAGDRDLAPGVRALHVPGHTEGSVCFLVDELLFTGDTLAWSRATDDLTAFRDATWHSWSVLTASLEALARRARFAWVLPGHGGRGHAGADEMRRRLLALVARMREGTVVSAW
ncbi:MAG TPA: ferredoxin [Candidatus Thermoplasmatota archaeon]|nr:ferredoxin [Candidatus Thermoplasmatota archaeon]